MTSSPTSPPPHTAWSSGRVGAMPGGPMERLRQLLQAWPCAFDTGDLLAAQEHLRSKSRGIGLSVGDPSLFRGMCDVPLPSFGAVGLGLGCVTAARFELSHQTGHEVLVHIPLNGHGTVDSDRRCIETGAGDVLLFAPSTRFRWRWWGQGLVLNLRLPVALFQTTQWSDAGLPLPFDVAPVVVLDRGRLSMLMGFVELLVQQGRRDNGSALSPQVVGSAEQLLMSLLIDTLRPARPWNASLGVPERPSVPYYVRRAEAHMRAHLDAPLRIQAVAGAVGVSRRTLATGFRQVHGTTPQCFLRRLRLDQARNALRDPAQAPRKVADIAADVAYFNLSQFSRDYRQAFGESPSQTAAAVRAAWLRR